MKQLIRIAAGLGDISTAPIAAEKLLRGSPNTTTAHQFTNTQNNFHCGVWGSNSGKWTLNYTEDEFCYIISGEAVITDSQGHTEQLKKGDAFVVPAGFNGTWETLGTVQKFYAIYEKSTED